MIGDSITEFWRKENPELFAEGMVNRGIAGLPLYRAIFYLPSLIGTAVAIAVLWRQLFARDGLVNTLLWEIFGINGPRWISHPEYPL